MGLQHYRLDSRSQLCYRAHSDHLCTTRAHIISVQDVPIVLYIDSHKAVCFLTRSDLYVDWPKYERQAKDSNNMGKSGESYRFCQSCTSRSSLPRLLPSSEIYVSSNYRLQGVPRGSSLCLNVIRKRPTKSEKMGLAANKQKQPSRASAPPSKAAAAPAAKKKKAASQASTSRLSDNEDDDIMEGGGSGPTAASKQAAAKEALREQVEAHKAEENAMALDSAAAATGSSGGKKKKSGGLKAKAKSAAKDGEEEGERPDYVDLYDKSMMPRRRHK